MVGCLVELDGDFVFRRCFEPFLKGQGSGS
ncbi:MAG: hypothetical protein RJAPGHWK_000264 [Candidatus Fervidibacter sp.]